MIFVWILYFLRRDLNWRWIFHSNCITLRPNISPILRVDFVLNRSVSNYLLLSFFVIGEIFWIEFGDILLSISISFLIFLWFHRILIWNSKGIRCLICFFFIFLSFFRDKILIISFFTYKIIKSSNIIWITINIFHVWVDKRIFFLSWSWRQISLINVLRFTDNLIRWTVLSWGGYFNWTKFRIRIGISIFILRHDGLMEIIIRSFKCIRVKMVYLFVDFIILHKRTWFW